jgi:hypothetical protein
MNDVTLVGLAISPGTLSPAFEPLALTYATRIAMFTETMRELFDAHESI